MTSVVYFLRGEETGAIKIGTTKRLAARIAGIKTSSSEPVTLIGAVDGGVLFEKSLHDEFAAARIRREWFKPTKALLTRITELLAGQEELISGKTERGAAADDDYTKLAVRWLIAIEDKASQRLGCDIPTVRRDLALRLGLSSGMLENFRYGRKTNPISARDFFAIKGSYLAELQTQLEELKPIIKAAKACVAAEADMQIAMASISLGGAKSEHETQLATVQKLLSGE